MTCCRKLDEQSSKYIERLRRLTQQIQVGGKYQEGRVAI